MLGLQRPRVWAHEQHPPRSPRRIRGNPLQPRQQDECCGPVVVVVGSLGGGGDEGR